MYTMSEIDATAHPNQLFPMLIYDDVQDFAVIYGANERLNGWWRGGGSGEKGRGGSSG